MQRHPNKRSPYPLSMEEQRLLFSELAGHLARMALFKVNTGTREHEVCGLRWDWEVQVPEPETSAFIIPADQVKNGAERYVVLNRTAKSVIEACRGEHPEFVFTTEERDSQRHPQSRMNNSGWKAARERAATRYPEELGPACPQGFRRIRVHDLKHTFGYRLRAAGVSFEDRKTLLGHKAYPDFVFTKEARNGQRHPQSRMNNSGWKAARERAAERYAEELGRPCPQGFRRIRVHDLKHTFGYRLRAAGVSFEDRKTLLGHKAYPDFVFTKEARNGQRHPQSRMNNSGWKAARERAAERYAEELGRPCPQGFRRIRVHDLKHTFGYRLRAAGVSFEDRKTLLG